MSHCYQAPGAVADMMARVLVPGTGRDAAFVILGYHVCDPYGVEVTIQLPGMASVVWIIDRDLLRVGLTRCSGLGDVMLTPCLNAPDVFVHLVLRSRSCCAILEIRAEAVREFLDATMLMVPLGRESAFQQVEDDISTLAL